MLHAVTKNLSVQHSAKGVQMQYA